MRCANFCSVGDEKSRAVDRIGESAARAVDSCLNSFLLPNFFPPTLHSKITKYKHMFGFSKSRHRACRCLSACSPPLPYSPPSEQRMSPFPLFLEINRDHLYPKCGSKIQNVPTSSREGFVVGKSRCHD
jgi:hypothetical protein